MRDINVANGIVPLGEFKAKASSILKELSERVSTTSKTAESSLMKM